MLEFFLLSLLTLTLIGGFIAVFFNLFGIWIIFLGALFFAYQTHFSIIPSKSIWILLALAVVGELAEHFLSFYGVKKMGGSNRSVFGAFLGGTLGAIFGAFFFGVGVVVGGILGVFMGAALMDRTRSGSLMQSLKVGLGGLVGVAGSVFVKIIIALIMIQMVIVQIF